MRDEQALLTAARGGDSRAFSELTEVHRAELTAHSYQMLGSFHDAEDAVQDALLRAWRALANFEGRSSVRSWLHAIVTNTALDIARRRARRELSAGHGPASRTGETPGIPLDEATWLEPFPDPGQVVSSPEARYELRESLELAFVVALQHLPPLQRAVLILREVAGFSAQEVANQLSTSVPAVNSALQRARAAVQDRLPSRSQQAALRSLGDERVRALAQRYADAIEHGDIDMLLGMLTADATWSMPPFPTWYLGHDSITRFLRDDVFRVKWRHLATRANGQLAVGCYIFDQDAGAYLASVLDVLTLSGDQIADVTGFHIDGQMKRMGYEPKLASFDYFSRFGLPAEIAGP